MQRRLLLGLLISVVMAPGPGRAQGLESEESCVGKVRLRGPIWDIAANELEPGLGEVLDVVAHTYQQRCAGKLVVIESHAYALPTPELNDKLADLRASVVRHELSKRGVPASEMVVAPIGDRRPMFPGAGPDVAERNRRITFRVAN
jgi:outer membrane protein OmpA-like peptidoglycan-associated protein